MKLFQLISTDLEYDFEGLLMRAHEQFPLSVMQNFKKGLKEKINGKYFNGLFVYKTNDKVVFIFATNYLESPFKTNLLHSTEERMLFEENEYTEQLKDYKYSKSIKKKYKDVNIYNEDMDELFKIVLNELPENLLISIKFRRSTKHKEQQDLLDKKEEYYRNLSRKTTKNKTRMDAISKRTTQLSYLYDVDFKLCTKDAEKNSKELMLKFYNRLKTFTNNNTNSINITKMFRAFDLEDFDGSETFTKEELNKFIYVPSLNDFDKPAHEIPLLSIEQIFYNPKDDEFADASGVNMGRIDHPIIKDRYIYVPFDTFAKHQFTGGQTGSGKTAEVIAKFKCYVPEVGKIKNGFFYVDPKRSGAVKLLNHFMDLEQKGIPVDWSRIHYIDLGSGEYVPQLNLLQRVSYRDENKIIDRTLELFKDVYDSGNTPLMDKIFRNLLGSLVLGSTETKNYHYLYKGKTVIQEEDIIFAGKELKKNKLIGPKIEYNDVKIIKDGATILDSIKMINDKNFRQSVIKNIPGGIYQDFRDFWDTEIKASDYNSATNRLSLFQPAKMKRLYGINQLDFDFVKWAKEGHVVIMDALDLSDTATTLLIGQITSLALEQILNAGPVLGFTVAIDEGKRAQVSSAPRMTAEGREPGCWFYMASQDINLMKKEFTKELLSNINTYKIGRHSFDSAKIMANLIQNEVSADLISKLPDNTMILRTTNKDGEQVKMKVTNDLPFWYLPDGRTAEKDNAVETEMAINWTMKKAVELQARDWLHKDVIDKILFKDYKDIMSSEKMIETIDESKGLVKI